MARLAPARTEVKGLAQPRDDLYALFGLVPSTTSVVPVTAECALRVPAVGSAIRVISEAVACLDVSVKRIEADGTETALPEHPSPRHTHIARFSGASAAGRRQTAASALATCVLASAEPA